MSNGLLYALTVAIWGSTWLAIEFQLGVVPPDVSVFYRYALAATMLLAWCLLSGRSLRFGAGAHLRFMGLGLLIFCLNYVLTYHSQVYITSALAAIGFSTMLWMNMLNARLFFGMASDGRAIVGSLLGIAGIVLIFYPQVESFSWSDRTLFGCSLILLGALLTSFGNMISQDAQRRGLPVIATNAWSMAYGAAFTAAIAGWRGSEFTFDPSPGYVLSLAYLALVGSVVAFGAYLTLLGRIGPHRAGYAVVLFPVVAVLLSVLFEGLALSPSLLAGAVLVLAGNVFVLQGTRRRAAAAGAGPAATTPGCPVPATAEARSRAP